MQLYLSLVAYMTPYVVGSDNFFSTLCQVQTLFVLLAALLGRLRTDLQAATATLHELGGPEMKTGADDDWSACFGKTRYEHPYFVTSIHT